MRRLSTALILLGTLALNLFSTDATSAAPMAIDDCSHDATIQALRDCVEHAAHHGHIDNAGIATSLLAKLDAAATAIDRAQPAAAMRILTAFTREVAAQDGKHIAAPHAEHLIAHAELVMAARQP
jgi:hypothetical protein